MALTNIPVTIGKGGLSKVIAKIGESSDLSTGLYFGYDSEIGSGVVVAGGKIVSSRILNLTATDSESSTGVKTIEVTYVDTTEATGKKTESFEVVSYDGVKSVIDSIVADDLLGNAENGAVTITPSTDSDGKKTFAISVNVDGTSVKVNGDGNLAVDTYTLVAKADSEIDTDNVAEYVFTTTHADGTADSSILIEIPKAKAIQTAGLVEYLKGSDLTDAQKTELGSDYDADAYYCVNLDTDKASKVDSLPSNVNTGETYLHFVWGGDAGETNMAASELAVNYAGSEFIDVKDSTISLKYDDLAAKLVADYSIDKVAALDASLNGTPTVYYTQEEADEENKQHYTDSEGRTSTDPDFDFSDPDGSYEEGYTPITTSTVKEEATEGIADRVDSLEEIVSGTGEGSVNVKIDKIDTSINGIEEKQATTDASVNALETAKETSDASINALETAKETSDASIDDLTGRVDALDTSVNGIESDIESIDASIGDILDKIGSKSATYYTSEDLTEVDGVTYVTSTLEGAGTEEDPYDTTNAVQANVGDEKTPAVKSIDERVDDIDASVAANATNITNIDSSVTNIYNRLTWVDLDENA